MAAALFVDFGRANRPWIVYWNYAEKYATNPVIDFHVIQEPRMAADNYAFRAAFPRNRSASQLRLLQLTNTRLLLGFAGGSVDLLNQQLDPVQRRFRVHIPFALAYKIQTPTNEANADRPSVLLLNDKFDSRWNVRVDGRPAGLLRCNFLMRGVYLQSGKHTVEFRFEPPMTSLYVSLAAIVTGVGLCGFLALAHRRGDSPATSSSAGPPKPKSKGPNAKSR